MAGAETQPATMGLFQNDGSGHFCDVTAGSGLDVTFYGQGCAVGDSNNDDRVDVFISGVHGNRLFENLGNGRFHNGNGRFTDVSKRAGVQVKNPVTRVPAAKSLGVAPADLDSDGWLDLVVANDTVQNHVFHNNRDGTFKEIGALTGIAFDSYGQTRGAMGVDVARFRNDDAIGIAIGNFANEMTALYVSQPRRMTFADEAFTEGIGPASRLLLKFGIFFFDYDLDGRLDVLTANGHLETEISKVQQSQTYAQPAQLFWNSGAGRGPGFVTVPPVKCGEDLFKPIAGRGSAYADMDGDGDLDAVLTQTGGPPLLLRNDRKLGHRFLRLKLIGVRANRDAIGTEVRVQAGGKTMYRTVMPTRGYLSQSELPLTFGLGKADQVDSVEVRWPGGQAQTPSGLRLNTLNIVRQEP